MPSVRASDTGHKGLMPGVKGSGQSYTRKKKGGKRGGGRRRW